MSAKTGSDSITGGCACGVVRYTAIGESDFSFRCYCRACQYNSGGSHAAQFRVNNDVLEFIGNVQKFTRDSDGGFIVEKGFCSDCGTPIYTRTSRFSDKTYLFAGTLDNADFFHPDTHVYTDCAPSWSHMGNNKEAVGGKTQ